MTTDMRRAVPSSAGLAKALRPARRAASFAFAALLATLSAPSFAADIAPPAFLDQPDGAEALAWVRRENARSLGILEADPSYPALHATALALAETHDRIPAPELIGDAVYNFWQDRQHVRGIWRRTTLASYLSPSPQWTTVIDVDALAAREHENWVWEGVNCAEPGDRLCLIQLSDGGEDAQTMREFDLKAGRFVGNGFVLPRAKQDASWDGEDALLVARPWDANSTTHAGYPFIVRRVARGVPLAKAQEVFRGQTTDVTAHGDTLVDGDGHRVTLYTRAIDFFNNSYDIQDGGRTRTLDLPKRSEILGLVRDQILLRVDADWTASGSGSATHVKVAAGSLVAVPLAPGDAAPVVLFTPGPRQSLEDASVTRDAIIAITSDNVRGRAESWSAAPDGGWTPHHLALPDNATIHIVTTADRDDHAFLSVTSFLTPGELWLADAATGAAREVKSVPPQFDASQDVVEQHEAVSNDGTHVPYFVVRPRAAREDGHNPTELYAYGGFQVSMTPRYDPMLGRAWLAHGGIYVLANIRGGGEFGPAWHDQATGVHRQRAFDDFASVARDLIARHITDPAHLGIRGGSNGGLLMGVEFTQHPELWRAVVIEVPLLDMLHYETMSAGASWAGEYGSVSVPAQRAFLASISPLQNLKPGVDYPEPFIFTTTKDDRVGPVHARRFAWRMSTLHLPFLYYEEIEGGHAAGANLEEAATERALEYTYLTRKLMRQ